MPSRRLLIALVFFCMVLPHRGAAGALEEGLQAFLRHPAIRGARVGVLVEDLERGERLLAHRPERALVPASNQKLLIPTCGFPMSLPVSPAP